MAVSHLGTGIYTRAEAARLLRLNHQRVSRWIAGYHYPVAPGRRKAKAPVVEPRMDPRERRAFVISFVELMELRAVKTLVTKGLSLQKVRQIWRLAARIFDSRYPLVTQRMFTDGAQVFAQWLEEDPESLIELSPDTHEQLISGAIFSDFLNELDFDEDSNLARRWWPLTKVEPILLDPKIAFGAPVIAGTATRTDVACGLADAESVESSAKAFHVNPRGVKAAIRFERELRAA